MRILPECAGQDPRKHTGDTGLQRRSGTYAGEYGVTEILVVKLYYGEVLNLFYFCRLFAEKMNPEPVFM